MEQLEINEKLEIADILYGKCKECRIKGENDKSWHYFKLALKIIDGLKLEDFEVKVLLCKLLDEFCIFSYYVDKKEEGLLISDKLIFDNEAHQIVNIQNICRNQKFYMSNLDIKSKKEIKIKCEDNYVAMNPSIIKTEKGYLMNYRTSNFGLKPGGVYYCRTSDGIINTINYILELNKDLEVLSKREVIDISKIKLYNVRPIKGLEDLIIFNHREDLWGTCTLLDVNDKGVPQIGLCKLELNEDKYLIKIKRPFKLIQENRPEKNWLPFSHQDELKLIYGYTPIEIRTPSELDDSVENLESKSIITHETELNFERFRGSAGPIKFELGWLVVIHEVSWNFDNSRVYTHRFVYFNENFEITKLSEPWYFESHGIEFCRSMCESHNPEEIIITCGLRDEEAWCYIIEKDKILKMLKDLKHFKL